MAKRGRPRKPEEDADIHKKNYYTISPKREKRALHIIKEERLLAGYEKLYKLAYGEQLSWSYKERLKEEFKEWDLLI